MTKTKSRVGRSPEAQMLKRALAGLRDDLLRGALEYRPLPPLAPHGPVVSRLPRRLRSRAAWLPHGLILLAAFFTAVYGWLFADGAERLFPGLVVVVLCAGAVLLTLVRPGAAWWLSLVALPVAGGLTSDVRGGPWIPATVLMHLTVVTVVAARTRVRTAGWMWGFLVLFALAFAPGDADGPTNAAPMLVGTGILLLLVSIVHIRRDARREVVAERSVTAVERDRRTLLEERSTIARELHDVVAHHMSVVAIQAEAAQYRVENPPPELQAAFVTIRENAVSALTELRRVLGVVRAADYEAPDAPQPTLADLGRLIANVRDTGLEVEHITTGAVRVLPQGVELSAYRIVQEALSNVLRHAPGASARVEVSYVLGGIGLRVLNGPAVGEVRPSQGSGHGVTGMRERVAMLNGGMTAEPTADGGFEVSVFVPLQGDQPVLEDAIPAQRHGADAPVPDDGAAAVDLTKSDTGSGLGSDTVSGSGAGSTSEHGGEHAGEHATEHATERVGGDAPRDLAAKGGVV
ncbi:sensor histidine kinase [Streptomyces sp. NPDC004111]|uniref:sensor histidine kinase n=1 Tax=Streptomyces sp. NPDC004111 TaxID=3364690 RepID=UPI00369ADA1B